MKKITGTILALTLVLTMTAPAFANTGIPIATPNPTATTITVTRLYGQNRYETAIAIANDLIPVYNNGGQFDNIVLASGNNYPDALAGAPLAKVLKAPILLLDKTSSASTETLNYVKAHLKPGGGVYILGGSGLFPTDYLQSIETTLGIAPSQVTQIGGADREATSLMIAQKVVQLGGNTTNQVILVSANNFYDALTGAPRAAYMDIPMLLVSPNGFSPEQKAFVDPISFPLTIGDITKQLNTFYPRAAQNYEYAGANEYETNATFDDFFSADAPYAYVATGEDYPDALAGAVLAGASQSTAGNIWLVQPNTLPSVTSTHLNDAAYYEHRYYAPNTTNLIIPNLVVFGGSGAVSDSVVQQVQAIIQSTGKAIQ